MSRGSRTAKSKTSGMLQLYRPLVISWRGKGDLPLLTSVDPAEQKAPVLQGRALMSAMYVNELMMYLLHKHDVNEQLFELYHDCLYALQQHEIEPVLRLFEKHLLEKLGFALSLECDADSGERIRAEHNYVYFVEHGPVLSKLTSQQGAQPVISGESLISYTENRLDSAEKLNEIKKLNRYILNHHLGNRSIKSRELFRRPQIK